MTEMTTTTVETITGGRGPVSTWAKIVDGEFVRGRLGVETGMGDNYLFVRNLSQLLDVVMAAQELLAAITERTTDA